MSENAKSARIIQKQLDELRSISAGLSANREYDAASRLLYDSVKAEERHLVDELEMATWQAEQAAITARFDGGTAVEGHSVDAAFLGRMLAGLQGLMFGVAQVETGAPAGPGPVSEQIASSYTLRVRAFVQGSFKVELDLPEEADQAGLWEDRSRRQKIVDDTLALFTEEMVEVPESRTRYIALMRKSRVVGNYRQVLEGIAKTGTSMHLAAPGRDGVTFSGEQAQQRIEWLQQQRELEQTVEVEGVFSMGDVDAGGRYKLVTEDKTRYHGRVSESVLKRMQSSEEENLLGATVVARLRIVTRQQVDDLVTPTIEYVLEEILEVRHK